MTETKKIYLRPEFWVGIIILGLGLVHLLHKLNLSFTAIANDYWPAGFILIGIMQILSQRYRDMTASFTLIVIGTILLLVNSDMITWQSIRQFWPETLKELLNFLKQTGSLMFQFLIIN